MMWRLPVLILAAGLVPVAPLSANDSTAETAAGGLVLTKSDDIDMVAEDLFVSMEQVRVRYVFRNRTDSDIRTIVAFPMPDRDLAEENFNDVAHPRDFATLVEGEAVTVQAERTAWLDGAEQTALLAEAGIPLDPGLGRATIGPVLDALDPAEQKRLVDVGLAGIDEYNSGQGWERHLIPLWTVRETWFWEQSFPAGRDLHVEHSYQPGVGGSVGTALYYRRFLDSPDGQLTRARFCIDDDFLAGIERLGRGHGEYPIIPEHRLGYVLTTANNWASPIGDFRLVIDKGAPENIVSFCADGVRKISPTQFEVRHRDWRPDADLDILILSPAIGE